MAELDISSYPELSKLIDAVADRVVEKLRSYPYAYPRAAVDFAAAHGTVISFNYQGAKDSRPLGRDIRPTESCYEHDGIVYFVGEDVNDPEAGARKRFRLDRITSDIDIIGG